MKGKTVLITGGTGSLGHALVERLFTLEPKKIIVFSRDELKQAQMADKYPNPEYPIRYIMGCVRDKDKLLMAFRDVDIVIHAAALKRLEAGQYNPMEFKKTNVDGAENIITAAIERGVDKVLAVSTDKACQPICTYGASKLLGDCLFIDGNSYSGTNGTRFSVIRFGNFVGSRGSVIPYFKHLIDDGVSRLPIRNYDATRFWIEVDKVVDTILDALHRMNGGEVFVPKMKAMRVVDFVKSHFPDARFRETELGYGEKLHERMVASDDARYTYETDEFYITIAPHLPVPIGARRVPLDFEYRSDRGLPWRA